MWVAGCMLWVAGHVCRLPINTDFRHLGKVKEDEKFRMF